MINNKIIIVINAAIIIKHTPLFLDGLRRVFVHGILHVRWMLLEKSRASI